MTRESLVRKFKPAGFEQPEGSRQNYVKPRQELQEAFYMWIDRLPEKHPDWDESEIQYQEAVKAVEMLGEIPYMEANSLLVDFKPKIGQRCAGLFISACYNHSPEEVIIFDIDASKINFIAYRAKKSIFNNKDVGHWFAQLSSGLIINNGKCGDWFVERSSATVINNGDCGDSFAFSSSGLVVAVVDPTGYGSAPEAKRIKPADCERIPDLKNYLNELEEITKSIEGGESAKRFLERYGPDPKERVRQEIRDIFNRRVKPDFVKKLKFKHPKI